MPDAAAIRAAVEQYQAAFSRGDREGWIGAFAPDATLEDPVGSEVKHGHEGIGEFWDGFRQLAAEAEMVSTGPTRVAGTEAAFPFQIRVPLGEQTMLLDVIDAMTFVDGDDGSTKIASMRAFWDMADMRPEEQR
jgi:steroid delta-isomerase